ncbi:nicotinate (nicotinamide) nucleotide adenylyltransferase [bacterium]|nr:nicotinate (nicotinamide) nucleotide adenylyltransferase [bacterium]
MKLCLFQGTFNPVHNAHLRLAEFALDYFNFDKILFVPAHIPPHKKFEGEENAKHRLNMVRLATEYNERFEVSDIEYRRNIPSYTFDTVCELYKSMNLLEKPYFLIGTDAFRHIESWHKAELLKELIEFRVFVRENNFKETDFYGLKEKGYSFEFMPLEFEDISSREIREKIGRGESVCGIIPDRVREYIDENGLYINKP